MRNFLNCSLLLILSTAIFGQVGINTQNPQVLFHIDGASDNPENGAPDTAQQANDFTVSSDGNVGIGVISSGYKLHIRSSSAGQVKIEDGTQGLGKVLTSNSTGETSWQLPGVSFAKLGSIPDPDDESIRFAADDPSVPGTNQYIANSGMSITLEPGKYQVNFTIWCAPTGGTAATTSNDGFAAVFFSSDPDSNIPPAYLTPVRSIIIPRLYNRGSINPDYYGSGNIAVDIPVATTLFLWVYMSPGNWTGAPRRIRFRYDAGFYGPYVQLYAIPFAVEDPD